MGKRAPWEVLGIPAYASHEEAHKAYHALARRWHPDRFMPGPEREWANDKMVEINTAYSEFTKGVKRRAELSGADLSKVKSMIDDGKLTAARELLMTMPTRCAEWNFLFGQLLYKLADYQKSIMYLSVAVHQDPKNQKYAAAYEQAQAKLTKKRRFWGR